MSLKKEKQVERPVGRPTLEQQRVRGKLILIVHLLNKIKTIESKINYYEKCN